MPKTPLLLLFTVPLCCAQTVNTAAVRGQVLDQSGGAIAGAAVEIGNAATGFQRRALTDGTGLYIVAELPLTGRYRVRVSAPGFASREVTDIELRAGEAASVNAVLSPEPGQSAITVFGTVDGVHSDTPELGTRLDSASLDHTPIFGRKLTALPLLNAAVRPARGAGDQFLNSVLFVANGNGRRQTSYVLDGATADDAWGRQTIFTAIPVVALQELEVLTNPFSAEYGRTAGNVVNVNTRAGTNRYHGDLLGVWRPGALQARPPLAGRPVADELGQASGLFSGPLSSDRAFFSLAAESSAQYRDSVVTSPLAPQVYQGEFRQDLALVRLDHRLRPGHSLTLRTNLDRLSDTNPADAVGGLNLPSAARVFYRNTYAAQAGLTSVLSPVFLNETRLQFQAASPITQFASATPGTQYVRPGVGTEGESRVASLINHQWQWSDAASFSRGIHNLRFGGDVLYSSSGGVGQEFGGGFVLGQFTLIPGDLTPVNVLTARDVQRYSQSFGNASYRVGEWLGSGFAQDGIRLRPNLTLNAGLRYDRQDFTGDALDFSPRAGFAWNPFRDAKTAVRGGYALFYSQIRANTAASYFINGPEGIFSFSAAPGQLGFPVDLRAPIPAYPPGVALPPRDISVRAGDRSYLSRFFDVSKLRNYPDRFLNPRTQQWSLGIERELFPKWVLSVDYVHQYTTRIDRPLDVNAPAPFARTQPGQVRSAAEADSTRPIVPVPNGYRRIIATVNDGMSRYDGLQTNLARRFGRGFSLRASYTWSHAINSVEPDVPQQDPNDAGFLGRAERATSLLDQRHRAVLSGWWQLPRRFTIGGVTTLASGRPYNITTGIDNNGDGSTADRPVLNGAVLGRNAGRGTPAYAVDTFAEREFVLAGDRLRLRLRGEAFNLFNHGNIVGRNGTWGNGAAPLASLGQPLGGISNVDPGREFQFQLRVGF